jgi:hypothetical protein
MIDIAIKERGEKNVTALNNLIVLAREDAGAWEILSSGGIKKLLDIMKEEKDSDEIKLGASRIFASLCKSSFKRVKF